MKSLLFLLLGCTSLFTPSIPTDTFDLNVELLGLKSEEGVVRVCLMVAEDQFLSDCQYGKEFSFEQGESRSVTFSDLPPGKYAIMAFHDEDGDNALECNGLFGMPSEPYAFSNNPSTFFGPPAYRKCVFTVEKDKTIKLKF